MLRLTKGIHHAKGVPESGVGLDCPRPYRGLGVAVLSCNLPASGQSRLCVRNVRGGAADDALSVLEGRVPGLPGVAKLLIVKE